MTKRKTTTVTERFDEHGNIYERVTQTVEEEDLIVYPPEDPSRGPVPDYAPSWPSPSIPYDPWWTHPITGDPITNPQITWVHTEPSIETVHTVYCDSETGDTTHEDKGQ